MSQARLEAGVENGPRVRVDPMVVHEAIVLPTLFLTVVLLGGVRVAPAGGLSFVPPPLMALVLAVLLVAALYRSGTLVVEVLMSPERGILANLNGVVVTATLFFAAAQVFNTLTPEAGLLAFAFNLTYLVLFGNTLAAGPDRRRQLASLLVVFGSAFVVKYVVLGAVYAPQGGLTKRVVLALLEGVSLGGLAYDAPGPATGYVAFAAVALFLGGLALLPRGRVHVASIVVVDEDARGLTRAAPPALDRDDR